MKNLKLMFLVIATTLLGEIKNVNGQAINCSYTLQGFPASGADCADGYIHAIIPANIYPGIVHHIYVDGQFLTDVNMGGYAGQTFDSPLYSNYGTWCYYPYYIDTNGQEISCGNSYCYTYLNPSCSITLTGIAVTNPSQCNTGKISGSVSTTSCASWNLILYKDSLNGTTVNSTSGVGASTFQFTSVASGSYVLFVYESTNNCSQTVYSITVKCPKPTIGFSTTNITSTKAKVNWTVVNCAYGYKIQYRKQGTTAWTTKQITTNTGFKQLTGLLPSTTYEWRVATKCTNTGTVIYSNFSTIHIFTTSALRAGDESIVESIQPESFEINIKPNPTSNMMSINFESENSIAQLKVINTVGQIILMKHLASENGKYEEQLNISGLKSGIYVLLIQTENSVNEKKFVKE